MKTGRPQGTAALRCAVAGASGLVGRELAARLSADQHCRELWLLLRRPVPDVEVLPKARRLPWPPESLPALDEACCALGTTMKAAGSQAAFRGVDFDAVLAFARAARVAGARRLGVVSSLGADPASPVFYNRVKGEMEQALRGVGFDTLVIARPSLLAGNREALGQPARLGERVALALTTPLRALLPMRVRPIAAGDVAAGMLAALRSRPPGVHVVESAELARLARPGAGAPA
jgi:uncharacterized protein YbjT (DUF2867 family)